MKTSMRFDFVDLRLFLFVVEAASITHGAARAGMALASASERIRLMEESLGAALLDRHRRGVRVTPAGAALAHHAQLVIQQLERMRGELSEHADGVRGRVRLFANTTASAEFLPASLAAFLLQHPQIDIDLEEHSSRDIVRAVAGDLAEIGIVGDEVNPAKELQTFPFAEDHLVLIAPRDHAVTRQRTIAFRDALAALTVTRSGRPSLPAKAALIPLSSSRSERIPAPVTQSRSEKHGQGSDHWSTAIELRLGGAHGL